MPNATPPDTLCSRRQALSRGEAALRAAGVERPRLEARLLLAHALAVSTDVLLATLDQPAEMDGYALLLARRAAREPVALILGRREFWSLNFEVSPDTLIPRPDSETVVEAALACAAAPARILDLGTGTGCLLLAVLSERPDAWGLGSDVSPGAAALASRNARSLGMGGRAAFVCADWDSPLDGQFDLVLSNPPYIETAALAGLDADVACYEPSRALDGGADGLDAYRRIVPSLERLLSPGGSAVLEAGRGQAPDVLRIGSDAGFEGFSRDDLGGVARAVVLRRSGG